MTGTKYEHVLVTGGTGLLGKHLKPVLPGALFPSSQEFNVCDYQMMSAFLGGKFVRTILHCAAVTSPPRVDKEPVLALETNIVGSANIAKLCHLQQMRLIYISTDYVFDGEKGSYGEEEPVMPVNKYAWTKLGGEAAARTVDNSLVVRLSFGPEPFPFEKAFVDQWTSREPVSLIVAKIVRLLESDIRGVIHIGAARRTVMQYAQTISGDRNLAALRRNEVSFVVPKDTSLDTTKYDSLFK